MTDSLHRVAEVVRRESGISLGEAQLPALAAALRRLDPPLDPEAFLRADHGPERKLLDSLIDEVTVNETFFFRQRRELDAIDWLTLMNGARAAGRERVQVWVAACSSGEEAYTLAILASEAFRSNSPPVSIVATDISWGVLEKARQARYGRRATRFLEPGARERHFVERGAVVEVAGHLRDLVEFKWHNLIVDSPAGTTPRSFDLITCRNVLIYFDGETVGKVIAMLERGLAPGGMLLLGAADRLCGSARRLARPDDGERKRPPAPPRELRQPLGREPDDRAPVEDVSLSVAMAAADRGDLATALELTERLLAENPLDSDAYFVRGLAELGTKDSAAAAASLRRALYVDPDFGLAAFKLGRAHEERGDPAAAARAYEQALRTLDASDSRHAAILDQVDLGDVAAACTIRLRELRGAR
jgi:chemotaxis protein methyltransferase CheR